MFFQLCFFFFFQHRAFTRLGRTSCPFSESLSFPFLRRELGCKCGPTHNKEHQGESAAALSPPVLRSLIAQGRERRGGGRGEGERGCLPGLADQQGIRRKERKREREWGGRRNVRWGINFLVSWTSRGGGGGRKTQCIVKCTPYSYSSSPPPTFH